MIKSFTDSEVMVTEDESPTFLKSYRKYNFSEHEMSFIGHRSIGLICQVYHKIVRKTTWMFCKDVILHTENCHPDTICLIEKTKKGLEKDSKEFDESVSFLIENFNPVSLVDELHKAQCKQDISYLEEQLKDLGSKKLFNQSLKMGFKQQLEVSLRGFDKQNMTFLYSLGPGFIPVLGASLMVGCLASSYYYYKNASYLSNKNKESICSKISSLSEKMNICKKEFQVIIEPVSEPSYIDDRARVSKFTWAVVLTTGPKGSSSNHTAIIVEGLANKYFDGALKIGEHFMHKSHFNPPVKSRLVSKKRFNEDVVQGIERTKIWMVSSEKVVSMLQRIAKEQQEQEEQIARGKEIGIAFSGRDSILSGGIDNCFTWARAQLTTLGIILEKTVSVSAAVPGGIWVVPRAYTESFEEHRKRPVVVQI